MRFAKRLASSTLLCLLMVAAFSCSKPAPYSTTDTSSAVQLPPSSPITITPESLAKLKWIEGTWRGTGDVQKPFYERYHFENELTLVMEELADETATTVNRTTRYQLKDGKFGDDHSVATALDDRSITFAPLVQGRNFFRWQSESKDTWKAILTLPPQGTAPAKETVYKLERMK